MTFSETPLARLDHFRRRGRVINRGVFLRPWLCSGVGLPAVLGTACENNDDGEDCRDNQLEVLGKEEPFDRRAMCPSDNSSVIERGCAEQTRGQSSYGKKGVGILCNEMLGG